MGSCLCGVVLAPTSAAVEVTATLRPAANVERATPEVAQIAARAALRAVEQESAGKGQGRGPEPLNTEWR